jgi:hypothetical protein
LFQTLCWSMPPHSWRRSSDGFPWTPPTLGEWLSLSGWIRGTSLGKSPWWLSKSRNHILKNSQYLYLGVDQLCVLGGIEIWDCIKCFFGWRNGKTNHFWLCEMEFSDRFPRKFRDGSGESKAVSETLARKRVTVPFHAVRLLGHRFHWCHFHVILRSPYDPH